jgi:hypothetical protein
MSAVLIAAVRIGAAQMIRNILLADWSHNPRRSWVRSPPAPLIEMYVLFWRVRALTCVVWGRCWPARVIARRWLNTARRPGQAARPGTRMVALTRWQRSATGHALRLGSGNTTWTVMGLAERRN